MKSEAKAVAQPQAFATISASITRNCEQTLCTPYKHRLCTFVLMPAHNEQEGCL